MIYLDNAATSWPKPPAVYEMLGSFLQESGANPGRASHRMAANAAAAIADCRLRLARLFNAPEPERVVFTSNATESLNLAILGLGKPGTRILTTTVEHNSVARPLAFVQRHGADVVKIGVDEHGTIDVDDLRLAANGVDVIAMTHASNVNGAIQPISACAEIAREHGALLLVDASQTAGAIPIDVQVQGIDLLAFPGHKGLLGPPGTGGLYIGPRVPLGTLEPMRSGGTGYRSEEDHQPEQLPFRYESGTGNTVGIAALAAGLKHVEQIGVEAIHQDELRLVQQLIDGLSGIAGLTVYKARDEQHQAAVLSFAADGWEPSDVGTILDQSFDIACRTGLHCAPDACRSLGVYPSGTVRLSPGPFTTEEEIDTAVSAVSEIIATALV